MLVKPMRTTCRSLRTKPTFSLSGMVTSFGLRNFSSPTNSFPNVQPDHHSEFRSFDNLFETNQVNPDTTYDPTGRTFNYMVLGTARFLYTSAARLAVIRVVGSLSPSADVLAMASFEVDISKIAKGQSTIVKWRGKPVFIRHRTEEDIAAAVADDNAELRDKQTDAKRTQKPEWLILVGICTHLGCIPLNYSGNYKGWFCPCHGSHYDTSGRIRIGPAPLNLEVPEYKFLSPTRVLLGVSN